MTLAGGQMVDSGLWSDYVSGMEQSTVKAYSGAVKAGYANGESISQIAARFKTISDGLLRREAEALARTGVQHYAQAATEAMYQANKDVIKKMIYFATLDNRTTSLCAGRDGSKWDIDDQKRPPLPAHWGCRSRYIPETRGMTGLEGTRTATGGEPGQEAREEFQARQDRTDKKVRYRGRKDLTIFDVSKVKATTEYESFFLDQPSWWQDSVFGPTRAKLVRSGGMKISQFNDMTGRQLTLKELRELDAEAFRRAGL
jgi:SPP1 gp7 family putative phage head morphogenesis protein